MNKLINLKKKKSESNKTFKYYRMGRVEEDFLSLISHCQRGGILRFLGPYLT